MVFKKFDRVRVLIGVDRGRYGTVIHVSETSDDYYGVALDGQGLNIGYCGYELEAANPAPNTLSLSELNAIAAEFGIEFMQSQYRTVFTNHAMCEQQRLAIADRCEDAGLQWCEPLRNFADYRHIVWYYPFTLID